MAPLNSTEPPTAFAMASTLFSPACRACRASETDATVPSQTEPATDAVDHRRAGRMLNHDRVSPAIRVRPVTKCLNVVAVAESHVWHETASSACAPNYPQNSLCALHKTIS